MPRLSVDLDLVFTDHTLPREQALRRINEAISASHQVFVQEGVSLSIQRGSLSAAANESACNAQRNRKAAAYGVSTA